MRTTVRLPEALLARAKKKARDEGTTLTALIEEGLALVLKPAGHRQKGREVDNKSGMPISKHRGGLMPGIDPIKLNSQTQEIEDVEMLRRLGLIK